MLSKFLRKITIGLLAFGIIFTNIQINTYAADLSDETYRISSLTEGELNVLVVRLGYKDYPLDETNDYYTAFSDKIIHKLFEGDEEGFSTPYNGVSDYLKKSSYNRMSVKVGNIINIEMDSNYKDYLTEEGQPYRDVLSSEEFIKKFNDSVTVSDYDKNNDGEIDALYFFDMAGDLPLGYGEDLAGLVAINKETSKSIHSFVFLRLADNGLGYGTGEWILQPGDINYDLNVIIHETGHLLLNIRDYYRFSDYNKDTNDIGDIMGNVNPGSDFDALSKLSTGWLTNDNVIVTELDDGESGIIELTPYDSDANEGKKLAVFKCGMYYVAADYCGGLNNNDFSGDIRKNGFRFYLVRNDLQLYDDLRPYEVLCRETQDGVHQLFVENEDLYDIFGKGLSITNIQTGANPSFAYTYTHKESNGMSLTYNVTLVDEEGNDITDKADYKFYVVESDFRISGEKGEKNNIYKVLYGTEIDEITTNLTVKSEGYSAPWLQLKAKKGENGVFAVSPDLISSRDGQVTVSETDVPGTYNVQIVCEKNTPSAIDEAVLPPFSSISYKISVLDDTGNDVTDDVEIIFDNITDTDSFIHHYVEDDSHILNLGFSYDLPQVDTKINLSAVPDGYIASDIVVNMVKNSDNSGHTVTSSNANVEVIEDVAGTYEIKITLQKEQQEETAQQSDDTTESSDDNTQGTEEITETSDDATQPEQEITEPSDDATQLTEETKESSDGEKTGSTDEQTTTSEEIKNNDNAKESSSSEESVKKPTETVSRNSSGNDKKVSVMTPKANDTKAENSVIVLGEKAPETGDKNNTPLWIAVAGASAGVLATAVIARKRKQS